MADKSRRRKSARPSRKTGKYDSHSKPAIDQQLTLNTSQIKLLAWVIENPGQAPIQIQHKQVHNLTDSKLRTTLLSLQSAGLLSPEGEQAGEPLWKVTDKAFLITGKVSLHPDGFGFVATAQQDDDVYLGKREMRGLMPGDTVLVQQQHDKRRDRYYGELLGVVQRARRQMVGRIVQSGKRMTLMADDPAITEPLTIKSTEQESSFTPGSMVVARITRYPDDGGKPGEVVIERSLDDQHLAGLATEIATLEHDLPSEFPDAVIDEANQLGDSVKPEQTKGRKDLRQLPLVTIDGEDARDFDDAVFGAPSGKGWRLVVAIADVSSYVKPGSALDAEAIERGTSVYFPTRVLPMLPEALSNGLCSLRPEVDRLALVCDMQLAVNGEVQRSRFYPAVINSHARLTYRQADQVLNPDDHPAGQALELASEVVDSLSALQKIWHCRDQQRERRGALAFDRQESIFIWNADGTVSDIQPSHRLMTHRLIEEAMIVANVEAAKFLLKQKMPSVLRVHPPPSGDKLAELERMLLMHNIKPEWHNSPTPDDFARITQQASDRPDKNIIEEMLLRAQSLAVYQPIEDGKTGGHFGLALEAYSHFTSPIRRYPDLLVHRAIYQVLAKKHIQLDHQPAKTSGKKAVANDSRRKLKELAQHCSYTERRAEQASRDVEFRLKCHYLKTFEGENFEGWVTGVKNFGLFVELDKLQISGLVHVSNLGKDYYEYDERNICLSNRRTGQRIHLGDKLTVKLLRVDLEQRKIDFALQ